jgi:uncharacterized protein (DUF1697 family)
MIIYIALLRGINVGGKNMIKMADLKQMFEALGLCRVETYIQSGNIIFESEENEDTLRVMIENAITKLNGSSITVILRTDTELEQIIQDCPFSEEEIVDAELANIEGESLYVSLLPNAPLQEKIGRLNSFQSVNDKFHIKNRDIYLLLRHSIRNSKLANNLQKLEIPSTTRNWKTMNKLCSLVKARTDK